MMKSKITNWIMSNILLLGTVTGVLIGVAVGVSLRPLDLSPAWKQIMSYPGELFTRALQMMILPLITSSLIVGSASLNAKLNGKVAVRTMTYFIGTSFLNAIIGILLVVLIQPGGQLVLQDQGQGQENHFVLPERKNTLLDNFLDLGRNIIPNNIFSAVFQQTQTEYVNGTPMVVTKEGTNTLGIITFCLLFGSILGSVGTERSQNLIESFGMIDQVIMRMVTGVMWLTPVGVASIIINKLITIPNVYAVTAQLGLFVLTVLIGVLIYQLVIQQIIYFVIKRKNPFVFYAGMCQATITAFSTASTAVALPITFRCIEKQRIDSRIAHFVLPIGATVNKDGTALFVSVASVFIAQINGIELGLGQLLTVAISSTAVSIASASVPSAALALMFIVLNSVGVGTNDIGLLFAVDWLVDRIRTTQNLLGDCYATVIVEHFSKRELEKMDVFNAINPQTHLQCDENISSEINSEV